MGTSGKVHGGESQPTMTGNKAVMERLTISRILRHTRRSEILTHKGVKNKTELLLWIALVRSTLKYGLQTHNISNQDNQKFDGFVFYCIRHIQDIWWLKKPLKVQKSKLRTTLKQPITTSSIMQMRLKHAPAQT